MNKKVIVTGASKGIGKGIAKALLKSGYEVHICARDEDALKAAVDELSQLGMIDYSVLDISDKNAIKSFCADWKGSLYGLVNNAAIFSIERLDEDLDTWDSTIATNLSGVYWLTKCMYSNFSDGSRIVNIASQLGKSGRAGVAAYSATKFGIIGLTKCWAKELGARGITVNAVCPGWVRTEMTEEEVDQRAKDKNIPIDEFYNEICQPLELKRMNTVEEIADFVEFLLSSKAAGITGRDFLLQNISNQE